MSRSRGENLRHIWFEKAKVKYLNQRRNKLVCLEVLPTPTVGVGVGHQFRRKAVFQCDCGNVKELRLADVFFKVRATKSCGCIPAGPKRRALLDTI